MTYATLLRSRLSPPGIAPGSIRGRDFPHSQLISDMFPPPVPTPISTPLQNCCNLHLENSRPHKEHAHDTACTPPAILLLRSPDGATPGQPANHRRLPRLLQALPSVC